MEHHYPWQELQKHYDTSIKNQHLSQLLQSKERNQQFVTQFNGIILDYTHQKINIDTIQQFNKLVAKVGLFDQIQGLFDGKPINNTQNRAVLHTALRASRDSQIHPNTQQMKQILKNVHQILNRIMLFAQGIREGQFKGASGKQLKNLIVIGIGGSYLSIQFVYQAIKSHTRCLQLSKGRTIRFLANVDPIDFSRAIQGLNAQQTLVLVNSKTFTTAQTMLNAMSVKQWLIKQFKKINVNDQILISRHHICACSTNLSQTDKFGIDPDHVFGFWDFVGGRFSVWSAIGILPLAIHFGYQVAAQFLQGGHSIDRHLLSEKDIKKNIPLMLGLLGFYHTTIQKYTARAIVPYCQALCKFAPHIQQLDMESNGKRVKNNGDFLTYQTAVVNFGQPGTNGQHSFFQLLHQGRTIPIQFIGFTKSQRPYQVNNQKVSNHDQLMSNFFSQPDALAFGKSIQTLKSQKTSQKMLHHKYFPGDRPSLSLLFVQQLTPYRCGQLLALYQHRTSIQGFLWEINSYDQWGVQLGKVLAKKVREMLIEGKVGDLNSSTSYLLQKYLDNR